MGFFSPAGNKHGLFGHEVLSRPDLSLLSNMAVLNVSKFRKRFMVSSIFPKSERKKFNLSTMIPQAGSNCFRLFFGRIEETINSRFIDLYVPTHYTHYLSYEY